MINKNRELISVIVPCFNSGKTLTKTLDSIINQTWENKEIILVNDGSKDKYTLEVINKFKKDYMISVINQENLGLPSARNKGVEHAKGTYLFFLDSDDWIESDALDLMYKSLKANNDASFVYSDAILEGDVKKIIKKEYNFFEQLFLNQIPYSIFIPRNNWNKFGGYDENMKLGYEDWEFNIRLGSYNKFGIRLAKPIFHYNVSYSGMLISKSSKYHAQIFNYIIKKNKNLYSFKNILKLWIQWRKKPSSYPLIIFFPWYLIIKTLPRNFVSKLFILARNLKWFFSRNKILFYLKKYLILQ